MNADLDRVRAIFIEALGRVPPDEWEAFLAARCGDDAELRRHVHKLLQIHAEAGSFLDRPAVATEGTGEHQPHADDDRATHADSRVEPGTVIGPYKLIEQIGEGGMGTVWMARQREPVKRLVAVKLIKAGMDSRLVIARFEAERQALALMDHPNIARVLDAGTTGASRPYFVMDLVKGVPITKYCDEHHLTPRQRLGLFIPVCEAVQHAHQKGITHRDLKPSNVLVAQYDGKPVPKVIDFGVAKAAGQSLIDKTLVTGFGAIVGTLEYMSPEQAEINQLDIDTRSDIYSLGVLLYELLAGSPPFTRKELEKVGLLEMLRVIREQEPSKPSTKLSAAEGLPTLAANRGTEPAKLTRLVRGELDWIVMKALDKDRNRRYETANGFAADVQRYLADEPVQACPPSAGYRLRKFARRNKVVLTAILLIAIALVGGTVVSAWQASWAIRAETLANERLQGEQAQRTLAQQNAADANARHLEAETARQEALGNLQQAREVVDQLLIRVSEEKLFDTPQMELLRKALLEDALKFYQRFLRQAGSDPAVRLGTGEAYRRTGQIYQQLGQPDQAERAYREAIALLEKLVTDSPTAPANRLALALSYSGLGGAISHLGRYAESESALRRAIGLMQGLLADFPKHDGYSRILAPMEVDLAWVSERLVRVAGQRNTEEFYREKLQSQEKLLAAAPNDPHRRYAVASAQIELGASLYWGRGRPQEAERLYRNAIAANMKLTSEFPHTTQYRTDLAEAHHGLFLLLRASRRFKEAEEVYRESLPHIDKVVADAPTVPYPRRLLIEHYWDYALMLEAAGRLQEADKALQQAITGAETMWAEFPTYAWAPSRLACVHNHVGNKHQIDGRFAEAEAAYRKALDVSEKSARALPHTELRCRLAESCLHLGLLLTMRQRHTEANRVFRKPFEPELVSADACNHVAWRLATDTDRQLRLSELAVEFARKAVELAPKDETVWTTLGVAQFRAENWQESINALQKSQELRKGGDSVAWFFLAMAHWQLGHKDEARRSYDRAVEWMDKHQPANEELRCFRMEAEGLLSVEKKKD